jgi:hypothetical protein
MAKTLQELLRSQTTTEQVDPNIILPGALKQKGTTPVSDASEIKTREEFIEKFPIMMGKILDQGNVLDVVDNEMLLMTGKLFTERRTHDVASKSLVTPQAAGQTSSATTTSTPIVDANQTAAVEPKAPGK